MGYVDSMLERMRERRNELSYDIGAISQLRDDLADAKVKIERIQNELDGYVELGLVSTFSNLISASKNDKMSDGEITLQHFINEVRDEKKNNE